MRVLNCSRNYYHGYYVAPGWITLRLKLSLGVHSTRHLGIMGKSNVATCRPTFGYVGRYLAPRFDVLLDISSASPRGNSRFMWGLQNRTCSCSCSHLWSVSRRFTAPLTVCHCKCLHLQWQTASSFSETASHCKCLQLQLQYPVSLGVLITKPT